jgi:hypothetical protein
MRASNKHANPWTAFIDHMNQLYWQGCVQDFDQATVAFHYQEFCEGHTF